MIEAMYGKKSYRKNTILRESSDEGKFWGVY